MLQGLGFSGFQRLEARGGAGGAVAGFSAVSRCRRSPTAAAAVCGSASTGSTPGARKGSGAAVGNLERRPPQRRAPARVADDVVAAARRGLGEQPRERRVHGGASVRVCTHFAPMADS